jgi:hypothetical protein
MDWLLGRPAAPFLGEEDDFDAALVPPPLGIFLDNGMDAGVAFCPEHGYGPCPARRGIAFCPMQGYGASPPPLATVFDPPTPTPSAELEEYEFLPGLGPDAYMDLPTPTPEHFMPPGYNPAPELDSPPLDEEAGAPLAAAPLAFDLNVEPEDEETRALVAAASFALDLKAEVEPKDAETGAQALLPAGPATPPPEARRFLRRFAVAMASRQPGFLCADSPYPNVLSRLSFLGRFHLIVVGLWIPANIFV